MYIPSNFRAPGDDAMHALMRANPLATVVINGADGLSANPIPLLLDLAAAERGVLRGHVARANPMWQQVAGGAPALALFHGPGHYVSPGWYPSKREHGRVVPTWNYTAVHVTGTLRAVDDRAWLLRLLKALTDVHEQAMPSPWRVDDAPPDYIDRMLGAVVGIEIAIERLDGKWKVSQNQPQANRQGVRDGLDRLATPAATEMAALVGGESR